MMSAHAFVEELFRREAPSGDVERHGLDLCSYFMDGGSMRLLKFVKPINPSVSSLLHSRETGLLVAFDFLFSARFLPLNKIISSLELDKILEERRRTLGSCR